ncbi:hypothetical protein ABZ372_15770 [Streptomyces sp. NPDC005921]
MHQGVEGQRHRLLQVQERGQLRGVQLRPALARVADRWWKAMAMVEMGKAQWLLRKPAEALASWNLAISVVEERNNLIVLNDLVPRMDAARAMLRHSQGNLGS